MWEYGERSEKALASAHPDLALVFREAIKHRDIAVLEGHRGEDEQNRAFREGKSQLRWPESNHNHNPSRAVDAVPYEAKKIEHIPWDVKRVQNLLVWYEMSTLVFGIASKLGIRLAWGGNWSSLRDYPHYQLL